MPVKAPVLGKVKTATVIQHLHLNKVGVVRNQHINFRRLSMTERVINCFLSDPVQNILAILGEVNITLISG